MLILRVESEISKSDSSSINLESNLKYYFRFDTIFKFLLCGNSAIGPRIVTQYCNNKVISIKKIFKPPTSRLLELRLENYKKFCSPSKLRRSSR